MNPSVVRALVLLVGTSCSAAVAPAIPPAAELPVEPAMAAPVPSIKGVWLGTLHTGAQGLRVQLRLDPDAAHACFVDSLDQQGFDIPCAYVAGAGAAVRIDVAAVHGAFAGTIDEGGQSLTGTWTQPGLGLPLVLRRQATAVLRHLTALDPALPEVDGAGLRAVLDKDLAAALERGELAPGTDAGVTIGVSVHGARRVLAYGTTKPDALFEIGSVTKTFTGLLLAQLVVQRNVRFEEPVRELLPPGTVARPEAGPEVTLLDLSDQHSGLPRMPDNFLPADPTNPYADYDEAALFAWLAKHGVAVPAKAPFGYSNVGVGLLGHALARRAGVSYESLLRQEITGPLGMHDTVVKLTPALRARLSPGHDGAHRPAPPWDLGSLAGAGGIRSTASDMLTYLEAQLHPDRLKPGALAAAGGKTLPAALVESHVVRAEAGAGAHIALGWFQNDATGTFSHNGATGGYSAFAAFNPSKDVAVIVLSNTSPAGDFTDDLGVHVLQRLMGRPAVSLAPNR